MIWGNQHIKLKNKSLMYFHWINDDIILIKDIVDHDGKLSENFILKNIIFKNQLDIRIYKTEEINPQKLVK